MASFSRKRKFDKSYSISSINCSKCSQKIRVEATSNVKAECLGCLFQSTTEDGGFPLEMVGDEHQLQKDFQCPICLLIIRDATELPCNHLMCKSCLVKIESSLLVLALPSCSVCRKSYDPKQKRFVKSVDRMIQTSLKVKCHQNDCDWIGCIQDFKDHKKKCEYVLVPCPFSPYCAQIQQKEELIEAHKARCTYRPVPCRHCYKQFKNHQLKRHREICPEYPVVCPNDNCNIKIKRSGVEFHQKNDCLFEIVNCPFESFGCKFHSERRNIEPHRETERLKHETLLLVSIKTMKDEIKELREGRKNADT